MSQQWKQSVTASIYTTDEKNRVTQPQSLLDNFDLRLLYRNWSKYNISSQQITTKENHIFGYDENQNGKTYHKKLNTELPYYLLLSRRIDYM